MAEVRKISEGTFTIEDGGVRCFLLEGSKIALLIDSGMNLPDAREIAQSATTLPLELINTHADPDHISGNCGFERFYLSPAEEGNYRAHGGSGEILPVSCGDIIDLGDREIEVIDIPGHTPGSIALLDRANRALYSGDSVQDGNIFMFGERRNMAQMIDSLEKLSKRKNEFDTVYPSHGGLPKPPALIDEIIEAARNVVRGSATGNRVDMFGKQVMLYSFPCAGFLCDIE